MQQRTIDRVHGGAIPFDTFVSMLSSYFLPKVLPAEEVAAKISKSLHIFNLLHRGADDGFTAVTDLAAMLVRQGDALDESALRTMLQHMKLDGRRVHTSEVVRAVISPPS